jgi:hypothetical protein
MSHSQRTRFDAGLLLLTVLAVGAALLALDPVRPWLVFAAMLLVPGGAVLTLLDLDDLPTALGLAVVISLAIDATLATLVLWSRWWHPEVVAGVVAVVCVLLLADDLRRVRRSTVPWASAPAS